MSGGGGQVVIVLAFIRRSEFESRWSLQFFCEICVWKERKYKQKEAEVGTFLLKKHSSLNYKIYRMRWRRKDWNFSTLPKLETLGQ